jgi:Bacterial alpha-L-rhamnosidase 6 hairpin glycosidase domain
MNWLRGLHLHEMRFLAAAVLVLGCFPLLGAGEPFDYFENSWSVIGLKDYNHATRLTPQNELLLTHKEKVRLVVGSAKTPLSRKQTKTLLEGWLPVVLLHTEEAGVRYDFTLWATPLPTVKDWRAAFDWPTEGENFLNWISIKASNVGAEAGEASVQLQRTGTNAATLAEWHTLLKLRQSATTCFQIPFAPIERARAVSSVVSGQRASLAVRASNGETKRWLKRTINYWRGLLASGARIEVPSAKATHALKAAYVQQFIDNDHGVLKGGEGFYDEFYIRDGAYQILQFEEGGFADAARKAIASYLKAQRPDGRFETQKGQFDANGQALWALWQYWEITGDREFLKRAYPQMRRAVEWIKQARRLAPPDSPFAGLLPNAVADGEYLWDGKHHIVGYDFWNLRGLLCTADAAQALGQTDDAREFQNEAADYRRAIDAAWKRTGLPYFPPSWEKAGTHWGDTETLWPTELFSPDDPRLTASLHEVRKNFMGGFVEGTIRWAGFPDVIHPYMSSYTTMASLVRGEHEQFVQDFYWYLLHSTATHAFPEGIYYKKRTAWNDTIPHATGAANYAFMLRHALIHERGDELHLLRGVPDWWLEPGREIRVDKAPTHFGPLSLRVRGTAKGVTVKFAAPTRQPAQRIILYLPKSRLLLKPLKGVEVSYRADDAKRWDFPTVVKLYREQIEARSKAAKPHD